MNKKIMWTAVSLFSANAFADIDLSFNFSIIPANTPQIGIIRVVPQLATSAAVRPLVATLPEVPKPGSIEKRMLVSPKMIPMPIVRIEKAQTAKIIFDPKAKNPVAPVKALEEIKTAPMKEDRVALNEMIEISSEEYRMIQGLLLSEMQKKYDLAMSVFAELLDDSRFKVQAQYLFAETALQVGLPNEYRYRMLQVLKQNEDRQFKKKAAESLVLNADSIRDEDVDVIDTFISEFNLDLNNRDAFQIKRAKQNLSEGNIISAEAALHKINSDSSKFSEAVVLKANASYRKGDVATALSTLEKGGPKVDLTVKRSDKMRNLIYLTMARIYFQKGNYKSSYASYLKIDKSSPLWLQSTTEQALTQILAGDNIGAAGNMFSLHTEYFKKAYAPESYIIRTVGYLNLCQYGDAASALVDLTHRYGKVLEQLQSYKAQNKESQAYYNLVKTWLANSEQNEINGVPRAYIFELARHPNFLNLQKQINSFEDETQKFSATIAGFLQKEQSLRKNITEYKSQVAANKAKKTGEIQIAALERKIAALELEQQIAQKAPPKIEKIKGLSIARIQPEKDKLKVAAAGVLQRRFGEFLTSLTNILEQKDVLAYEIYSGAGEHLRYQMAGGKTGERNPAAALTPEEKQSYKWKFRGEVWDDEIGHYRSSLTNVCPDQIAKNQGGK